MHSCMHTFIHFSPHGPLSEHSSTHAPGACLLKRQLIDFDVQDHLGWTQQCSGKYLTINLLKKKRKTSYCRVCCFLWYKYSQHGQLENNSIVSLKACIVALISHRNQV